MKRLQKFCDETLQQQLCCLRFKEKKKGLLLFLVVDVDFRCLSFDKGMF